jgi:hypothetical protein
LCNFQIASFICPLNGNWNPLAALPTGVYNLTIYIRLPTPLKFSHNSIKIQKKRREGMREGGEEKAGT